MKKNKAKVLFYFYVKALCFALEACLNVKWYNY